MERAAAERAVLDEKWRPDGNYRNFIDLMAWLTAVLFDEYEQDKGAALPTVANLTTEQSDFLQFALERSNWRTGWSEEFTRQLVRHRIPATRQSLADYLGVPMP
jgi:hypothetical protein